MPIHRTFLLCFGIALALGLLGAGLAASSLAQSVPHPVAREGEPLFLPALFRNLAPPATPTATRTPTPPATATATPSNVPTAPANWLARVTYYRSLGGLPPVAENPSWSDGGVKHSRYMVKNNYIGHSEEPTNGWYTPEGLAAAQNGNVTVSTNTSTSDAAAIDGWIAGPFHAVGILDARLQTSGYGSYAEADGGWQWGATLDVLRGRTGTPPASTFPIRWPQGTVAIPLSYRGGEYPDPLTSCPGYVQSTGAPLMLLLGTGNVTPSVTAHSLTRDGTPLEHCVYDETSYTNAGDSGGQSLGRAVLGGRDAIILLPRQPLVAGASYQVSITTNGQTHSWSFVPHAATSLTDPPAELQLGRAMP